MSPGDSGTDATNATRSPELDPRDLERLRAAGAGARLAAGTGSVGLGLLFLQILDVAAMNPGGLGAVAPGGTFFFSGASSAIASLVAVGLFWAFGRNVSAHFAGGADALARAFRYLRLFFVVWTCATAVTVLLLVAAIW